MHQFLNGASKLREVDLISPMSRRVRQLQEHELEDVEIPQMQAICRNRAGS